MDFTERLRALLAVQRWFAGKARAIISADLIATVLLEKDLLANLLRITYADGGEETYFLPVVVEADQLRDALCDEGACRRLLEVITQGEVAPATAPATRLEGGAIWGVHSALFDALRGEPREREPVRAASHDQSNSAIVFGTRFFLKVFRKVEPGLNPDYEIARYLTERTSFARLPRLAGAMEFRSTACPAMTLATLQERVPNDGDAWQAMLRDVRSTLELARPQAMDRIERLGIRTAELHMALANATDNPAFAPESLTSDDCRLLAARLRRTAENVFQLLRQPPEAVDSAIAAQASELLARGPALLNKFSNTLAGEPHCTKTRIHGDYHLGQVLCQGDDFMILDFEGEPARSLAERTAKDSPLKDVAGMLRSFSYAAYAGLFAFTEDDRAGFARLEPLARSWQQQASAAFLRGYFASTQGASFLPPDKRRLTALLDFFIVEKALYEVLYELNHRPPWLRIPLAGILALA